MPEQFCRDKINLRCCKFCNCLYYKFSKIFEEHLKKLTKYESGII